MFRLFIIRICLLLGGTRCATHKCWLIIWPLADFLLCLSCERYSSFEKYKYKHCQRHNGPKPLSLKLNYFWIWNEYHLPLVHLPVILLIHHNLNSNLPKSPTTNTVANMLTSFNTPYNSCSTSVSKRYNHCTVSESERGRDRKIRPQGDLKNMKISDRKINQGLRRSRTRRMPK